MWERNHEPLPRHLPSGWWGKIATKSLRATRLGAQILTLNLRIRKSIADSLTSVCLVYLFDVSVCCSCPTKNLEDVAFVCGCGLRKVSGSIFLLPFVDCWRGGLEGWCHTADNQYHIPFLLFLASLPSPSHRRTVVVWREGSHLPVYWPARVDIIVNVPTSPVAVIHAQRSEYHKCCL